MAITISSLKNQAAFDLANKIGKKQNSRFFLMISHLNDSSAQEEAIYLGLKISKKLGNAVVRNKIRRRIKSMIRNLSKILSKEYWSSRVFVIIPRKGFQNENFAELQTELVKQVKYSYK